MGNNKKRKPHKKKPTPALSEGHQGEEKIGEKSEESENVCPVEKEKSPICNKSTEEIVEKVEEIKQPIEIVEQKTEEKVPNEENLGVKEVKILTFFKL